VVVMMMTLQGWQVTAIGVISLDHARLQDDRPH
jgi:hypothetical protein